MRRRLCRAVPEPPARLVAFDPVDWLPMVDVLAYDPDHFRNRKDGVPYGESISLEAWREQEARLLWGRARLAWHQEHGWPGGLTAVDLLRQERAARLGRTIR